MPDRDEARWCPDRDEARWCPHCGAHENEQHGALCPINLAIDRFTSDAPSPPHPRTLAPAEVSPADILAKMAETYRERNAVYGDNWRRVVGDVMIALYPEGMHLQDAAAFNRWHLFELIVVKLTRFANTGLTHKDSIHDIAVYAAMLEASIEQ